MTSGDVINDLAAVATPAKAAAIARFFKSGPGQYGEGDEFLGVTVPEQRVIARRFKDLPIGEIEQLMRSRLHEARLTALLILVNKFKRAAEAEQKALYDFYLAHAARVNNWDLVDSSAPYIAGAWLAGRPERMAVLRRLAGSELLWERRIAMVSTQHFIRQGSADEAYEIAELLLNDTQDLIQKAVGWMLRETGKYGNREALEAFLVKHAARMPRTALRYAIEHYTPQERQRYMNIKNGPS